MSAPTLVDFLRARLDEDEAVARAATNGAWEAENFPDGFSPMVIADGMAVCETFDKPRLADAYHIARHDPARVLADVKAKRAIVELHESWPVMVQTPPEMTRLDPSDVTSMTFRMSQQIAWLTTQEYRARFGDEPPSSPMIRALAAVYADHPDFDEQWRT